MMVRTGCSNTSFRPQFVKELQHADLHKLKLPSEFMMHVEDENKSRSVATVLSPRHKTWNIKLTRDRSDTFFKGNWREFSKYHKLEVGFKLVFRYEGNMVFNVKVFGLNGCLKDYNQDAETILRRNGFKASREMLQSSSSSDEQTKRKHDLLIEKETPRHERCKRSKELGTTTKSYVKKKGNKNLISVSHQTLETRISHYSIHKFMPFQEFRSESSVLVWHESQSGFPYIPIDIGLVSLPKIFGSVPPNNLEKGEITLHNEKEETWKVQFNSSPVSGNNLCRGWKHFCWINNIKCEDICTLKIIAKNEILVTISEAANNEILITNSKAAKTVETIDVESDLQASTSQ